MNEQVTPLPQAPAPPPSVSVVRRPNRFDQILQFLPTFLILVFLGFVGAWGYLHEWKLPKFSELTGEKKADEEDKDWCKDHGAPQDKCIHCHPREWPADPDFGWCIPHGVYNCVLDHPELAQTPRTPTVSPADLERVEKLLKLLPRVENEEKDKSALKRVQLGSEETIKKLGLQLKPVEYGDVVESVSAPGEITYNPTRVARLSSRLSGTVWRVLKGVGDPVKAGEVVALVDASEVGKTKTEFLQAFTHLDQKRSALSRYQSAKNVVSEATLQLAETAENEAAIRLQSAEQALLNLDFPVKLSDLKNATFEQRRAHLQFLGLPAELAREVSKKTYTANLIPLKAPLDGVVVARTVAEGEVIDSTRSVMTIVDVSQLWLTLEVRAEDAKYVKLDQKVRFQPDGNDGEVEGKIVWISTRVDSKTRTIQMRIPLLNKEGKMRDQSFGLGRIILREDKKEDKKAIVIPNEALHWTGESHIVFVCTRNFEAKDAPKVFQVRSVRPGARLVNTTEIIVGLFPEETIATTNSGVLRGDLLKAKIGAGEAD